MIVLGKGTMKHFITPECVVKFRIIDGLGNRSIPSLNHCKRYLVENAGKIHKDYVLIWSERNREYIMIKNDVQSVVAHFDLSWTRTKDISHTTYVAPHRLLLVWEGGGHLNLIDRDIVEVKQTENVPFQKLNI